MLLFVFIVGKRPTANDIYYHTFHTVHTWPPVTTTNEKTLGGQKFAFDADVQSAVCQWLTQQLASFFTSGIQKLLIDGTNV